MTSGPAEARIVRGPQLRRLPILAVRLDVLNTQIVGDVIAGDGRGSDLGRPPLVRVGFPTVDGLGIDMLILIGWIGLRSLWSPSWMNPIISRASPRLGKWAR
jgi:hypothetical protein